MPSASIYSVQNLATPATLFGTPIGQPDKNLGRVVTSDDTNLWVRLDDSYSNRRYKFKEQDLELILYAGTPHGRREYVAWATVEISALKKDDNNDVWGYKQAIFPLVTFPWVDSGHDMRTRIPASFLRGLLTLELPAAEQDWLNAKAILHVTQEIVP